MGSNSLVGGNLIPPVPIFVKVSRLDQVKKENGLDIMIACTAPGYYTIAAHPQIAPHFRSSVS